jgi:mRNA interferase MazF
VARFVRGDVVVSFPFSDLTETKKRPALVLAEASSSDFILCQITSQAARDARVISLKNPDFQTGFLRHDSYIRPNRLFTASDKIILYKAAHLRPAKFDAVIDGVLQIIQGR